VVGIVYAPAFHEGYLRYYKRAASKGVETLYLIDPMLCPDVSGHERDFTVAPEVMTKIVADLKLFKEVKILTEEVLKQTGWKGKQLYAYKHALVQDIAKNYLKGAKIAWDSTFLRWDMPRALNQVAVDGATTTDAVHRKHMARAWELAAESPDPFRQVGAVAVKDGKVLAEAYNRPLPDSEETYKKGDPAAWRSAGKDIHITKFMHAEAGIIATAGNPKVEGCDLYVTVFPCPTCANMVAVAKVKRVFFQEGYSNLDAHEVLSHFGVEMIRVIPK
jgi:dCMP deaminase